MRAWLLAYYFGPNTMVRHALPVPQLDPTCAVDATGVPQTFLPLATLWHDPSQAFTPSGHASWVGEYQSAIGYQNLVQQAVEFGLEREAVNGQVLQMKAMGLPADFSLLLDMCGVTSLEAARLQQQR